MASLEVHDPHVDLLGTVQVLHEHWTASVCQTVFEQTRTTARARTWTLEALAEFWTAVLLRAPQSLPQALEEATAGTGAGWPAVQASPEAFFERGQSVPWRFFAQLSEACVAPVLPEAGPGYAQPLPAWRQHCPDVWVVEGARRDAVAHRLKLLHDGRAWVLPGCLPACSDLHRGLARHRACEADAAAGALPRTLAALQHVPQGTRLGGDRLYGVGQCFAALGTPSLAGLWRRNGRQSWRWVCDLSTT